MLKLLFFFCIDIDFQNGLKYVIIFLFWYFYVEYWNYIFYYFEFIIRVVRRLIYLNILNIFCKSFFEILLRISFFIFDNQLFFNWL